VLGRDSVTYGLYRTRLFAAHRQSRSTGVLRAHTLARQLKCGANQTLQTKVPQSLFEATFALYAREKLNYSLGAISTVFVVCGVVMTVFRLAQ